MLNNNWEIDKKEASDILLNPDSSALALFIIAVKTVGHEELFQVDEDTGYVDAIDSLELFAELEDQFNVSMPVENENKLNALLLAFTTQIYFEDPIAFTSISMAINSGDLGEMVSGVMETPTIEEILTTKMEIELIIDEREYEPSVKKVIQDSIKDLAEDDNPETPEYTLNQVVEEHRAKLISELTRLGIDEKMTSFIASYDMVI